jgi:hypothetical protein
MQSMVRLSMSVAIEGAEGLGIPMSTIAKICRETGRHDVLLAIEEVDRMEPHRPKEDKETPTNGRGYVENAYNSSAKLLSRLKREQPVLLDAVFKGDKTIHAACVEAGFRKREVNTTAGTIDHDGVSKRG